MGLLVVLLLEPFAVFGGVCWWSVVFCWGGVGFVAAVLSDGFGFVVDHAGVDEHGSFVVGGSDVFDGSYGVGVVDGFEDEVPCFGDVFVVFLGWAEGLDESDEFCGFGDVHC